MAVVTGASGNVAATAERGSGRQPLGALGRRTPLMRSKTKVWAPGRRQLESGAGAQPSGRRRCAPARRSSGRGRRAREQHRGITEYNSPPTRSTSRVSIVGQARWQEHHSARARTSRLGAAALCLRVRGHAACRPWRAPGGGTVGRRLLRRQRRGEQQRATRPKRVCRDHRAATLAARRRTQGLGNTRLNTVISSPRRPVAPAPPAARAPRRIRRTVTLSTRVDTPAPRNHARSPDHPTRASTVPRLAAWCCGGKISCAATDARAQRSPSASPIMVLPSFGARVCRSVSKDGDRTRGGGPGDGTGRRRARMRRARPRHLAHPRLTRVEYDKTVRDLLGGRDPQAQSCAAEEERSVKTRRGVTSPSYMRAVLEAPRRSRTRRQGPRPAHRLRPCPEE